MGSRFTRQEKSKITQKLVSENVRRVFFASLCLAVLVPILGIINKLTCTDEALLSVYRGIFACFEVFSLMSAGVAYAMLRIKDSRNSTLFYRVFWVVFELFSFAVVYSETIISSKLTFYSVMLMVLLLAPAMSLYEQMYYIVIQAVFIIFMGVKSGVNAHDVFNIAVINCLMFGLSRILYNQLIVRMMMNERAKTAKSGTTVDVLTGLLNRKGLEHNVYNSLPSCIRNRKRVSVLMIDIDDMQCYNNSYGSDRGDECIKVISELIKQVVIRNTDTVCRLNGGRFLVYMEGGSDMEPVSLAEKLRSTIERKRVPHGRRASNDFVTVSIGVASCIPKTEGDFSELYDEAEDALFEAKEHGKNLTIYDEQMYGQYRKAAY